ncbi:MAG: hypothetical protein CEN88_207, partial [Candidatus Berkelbacteria bacterium Licking1014_2]
LKITPHHACRVPNVVLRLGAGYPEPYVVLGYII